MRRILLVCFDNLRELVFLSSLTETLSQEQGIELAIWCKDYSSRLAWLLPGVKQVFAADPFWTRAPGRKKGRLTPFFTSLGTIRQQAFTEAWIIGESAALVLALRAVGIKTVMTVGASGKSWFATRSFQLNAQLPKPMQLHAAWSSLLGGATAPPTRLNPEHFAHLERPEVLKGQRLLLLHPFGRETRRLPLELWKEIAQAGEAQGYFPLWTGLGSELQLLRQTFGGTWNAAHYADSWALDLLQLAWIWSEAEIFVGHDSGPLHCAQALGAPVVLLEGASSPAPAPLQGRAPGQRLIPGPADEPRLFDLICRSGAPLHV